MSAKIYRLRNKEANWVSTKKGDGTIRRNLGNKTIKISKDKISSVTDLLLCLNM